LVARQWIHRAGRTLDNGEPVDKRVSMNASRHG
jgi:hypothetical protein